MLAPVGVVMLVHKQVGGNVQQIRVMLVAGFMEDLDMVDMLRLLEKVVLILLEVVADGMVVVPQK